MTRHRALNWTLAALLALLLSTSYLLNGPTELQATQAVAADVQDAIQTAQAAKP